MSQGSATLVCFAVKEEARPFMRLASAHPQIEILLTGMGQKNAEKAIRAALARRRPERVITAGFAGALNPELVLGSVVYKADENPDLAKALRAAGARPAVFHCAPSIIATARQKQELFSTTKADAVEMESRLIYDFCRQQKVPAAIVRVILDTAGEDLILDFNKVMTSDLRIDPARLAVELARSPGKIPGLLRLQKQSSFAARSLSEVLARLLL